LKVRFEEKQAMKHWIAGWMAMVVVHALVQAAAAQPGAAAPMQASEEAPKQGKTKKKVSDGQVRKILIDESIAGYSGNCPCPYSTMSNGRSCGRRSAYSREGGESPLCYAKDVTAEMVQAYRDANPAE
jgi:hypothetical protein